MLVTYVPCGSNCVLVYKGNISRWEDQPKWSWKLKLLDGIEYPPPDEEDEDEDGCQYDYIWMLGV